MITGKSPYDRTIIIIIIITIPVFCGWTAAWSCVSLTLLTDLVFGIISGFTFDLTISSVRAGIGFQCATCLLSVCLSAFLNSSELKLDLWQNLSWLANHLGLTSYQL